MPAPSGNEPSLSNPWLNLNRQSDFHHGLLDDLSRGGVDAGSAYVFSLEDCVLELRLEAQVVRPGEELRVGLALKHNRPETVTVVVVSQTTPALTFHHGDTLRREVTLPISPGTPPGHRVLAGVERMRQGLAGAAQPFWVVASSALPPSR